jgi:hypothetical protein
MFIGIGPYDMFANLSGAMLALGLGSIAVFFGIIYLEEITVSVVRLSRYALRLSR